jgi:hypothetical protein
MFSKKLATAFAFLSCGVSVAYAEPPIRIGQFDAWGAYSYQSGGKVQCYALSTPTSKEPSSVDHGDNFFIVSREDDGRHFMPQAIMGYDLKQAAPVTASIGDASFAMFTRERHAWIDDESREPAMVSAMKAGDELKLHATSRRGTKTSYSYSLSGITAALDRIKSCN